jgi:N-acetylglucosaminyldiphosphoundecaprenol N-acetyl-beta-D-mannosaminyltransferase
VLFGVPFHNVTLDEALSWIAGRARSGRSSQLVTTNLDFILQAWKDPEMHRIHYEADLVVADGWPPVAFSGFFGPRLKERVAGSDIVPRLASVASDHGLSLYALGGRPGVAQEAMRILQERSPGLRIAGCGSPPLSTLLEMDHAAIRREIAQAQPDILLVAFGAPKQDKWIRMNSLRIGVPVSLGIGASLDFIAGAQTRAPRWVRAIGMEWFWRLASQPVRLFRRYSSNLVFLAVMLGRLGGLRLIPPGRVAATQPPDLAKRGLEAVPLSRLAGAGDAAEFCSRHEAAAKERGIVLDLSACSWLGSVELGAIAFLARAAREGGRAVLLSGVRSRVRRLLRLFRMDRVIEMPSSPEEWSACLSDLGAVRGTEWLEEGEQCRVVLPDQFECGEAWRAQEEAERRAAAGRLRRVVVDGRRLRYIDSSGLHFLKTVRRRLDGIPGGAMSVRSFPDQALDLLRREGLGSIPADASGPG